MALNTKAREDIAPGLRLLHAGGRGRHVLLFRPAGDNVIMVLRILHDAMDLARHIPPRDCMPASSPACPRLDLGLQDWWLTQREAE